MVLYHAMSTYQILECIEHKLLVNYAEESILVIYPFVLDKIPHYEMVVDYGFFSKVCILPYHGIIYDHSKFIDSIEKIVRSYIPYNLEDFTHIYVARAHVPFTAYLIYRELEFYIFEDGSGALSRPNVLAEIDKNANPNQFKILETYGLYDLYHINYKNIKGKYCDFSAQVEGFYDELAIDFNLVNTFTELEECDQKDILDFFGCPHNIDIANNSVLLLTQQFSNLLQLSFEEHIMIYQTIIDYFLYDYEIIIKPHPDDVLFYDKLFPNTKIIKEKFPSELLPFIFSKVPKAIATISSTGVNLIKHFFDNEIIFNELYEKSFLKTHRYFFALKIIELLGFKNFYCISVNEKLTDNLLRYSEISKLNRIKKKCNVIIYDDYDNQMENESIIQDMLTSMDTDIFIFINSLKKYKFFDMDFKYLLDDILPIVINKSKLNNDYNYNNEGVEVIYIFTRNKEMRERINKMEFNIKLEKSEMSISKDGLRKEEIRIKVLEGQLEATEKRLLEYLKHN
jgi:hypothetical protein